MDSFCDRNCDSFCDANFGPDQLHDRIHNTICSTFSVHVYVQEHTSIHIYTYPPPFPCLPPLPLTRSGNEEEDDGPGGSALEHNYQPTLDRAYCEGIPPRTGPQGQGGLRPADPYQAWAPVRISPRYLHVILTVLKSLSNTL